MSIAIVKTINYRNLPKLGNKVEGTVILGNRYVTWKYAVNGINYEVSLSKSEYPFIIEGEKYYVYYDPNAPSNSVMNFCEPIIDSLSFEMIYSLPLSANHNKGISLVKFQYTINGDTINRSHLYKFNTEFSSKNEKFPLYIKSDNHKISYIKLES